MAVSVSKGFIIMRAIFSFLCFLLFVPLCHAQIIKEFPKRTIGAETVSFDYIESDKCSFQSKDIKTPVSKILKQNNIDLSTGSWLHVPDECWNIKSSEQNLLLISLTNKNKPLKFYIIDDGKNLGNVMLNLNEDLSLNFDGNKIKFSKQISEKTKNKILILFKQIDQESKGVL